MIELAWVLSIPLSLGFVLGVKLLSLKYARTLDEAHGWIVVLSYLLMLSLLAHLFGWPGIE